MLRQRAERRSGPSLFVWARKELHDNGTISYTDAALTTSLRRPTSLRTCSIYPAHSLTPSDSGCLLFTVEQCLVASPFLAHSSSRIPSLASPRVEGFARAIEAGRMPHHRSTTVAAAAEAPAATSYGQVIEYISGMTLARTHRHVTPLLISTFNSTQTAYIWPRTHMPRTKTPHFRTLRRGRRDHQASDLQRPSRAHKQRPKL